MTTSTTQPDIYATFLTDQQIWGDKDRNGQLQVMKSYGTKTGMSDLAIVLGGCMSTPKTSDGQRTGIVWSASSNGNGDVRAVDNNGDRGCNYPIRRSCGARPALPSSVTSSIKISSDSFPEALAKGEAIRGKPIQDTNGKVIWNDVILFGEYPQTIAPEKVSEKLEKALTKRKLQATGKKYTFDSEEYNAYDTPFSAKEYLEYQHNGKRYIRVEAKPYDEDSVLSNGHTPEEEQSYWVEVQPIEWLRDPSGICVARQALFTGVQFDRKKSYDGNFENTDMYRYLQDYFIKEIVPSKAQEHAAGVKEHDTPVPETKAKEKMTHYQDIVAKGSLQDWSKMDFSAAPKQSHR